MLVFMATRGIFEGVHPPVPTVAAVSLAVGSSISDAVTVSDVSAAGCAVSGVSSTSSCHTADADTDEAVSVSAVCLTEVCTMIPASAYLSFGNVCSIMYLNERPALTSISCFLRPSTMAPSALYIHSGVFFRILSTFSLSGMPLSSSTSCMRPLQAMPVSLIMIMSEGMPECSVMYAARLAALLAATLVQLL